MMMLLILMLLATNYRATESFGLDIIGNVQTAFNFFNDAVGVIKGDLPISALLTGSTGVMLDRIMESVGAISGQIDDLSASFTAEIRSLDVKNGKRFDAIEAAIERVMVQIPKTGKLNEDMREFRSYVTRVDSLYNEFEYYSKNKTNFNERTINYFIEAVISRNRGDLYDILQQMYHLIIQQDWYYTEGIMQLYSQSIRETGDEKLCGVGLSPQGRFFKMYETIYMAEAHGLMMQMFAFSVKSAYTRTSYIEELDLAKTMMLSRIEKYFYLAMNQMKGLSVVVELCDAPKYISGINYIQLDEILDTIVEFDYLLNSSVSLMPKKANVDENMVVTGIRFVKRSDEIIDYQIKEAKLLPGGEVALNGTWQELPVIDQNKPYVEFVYMEKKDGIYTNDVFFDSEYVIVGVDLELIEDKDSLHLKLCRMKFDMKTGQLELGSEQWSFGIPEDEYVGQIDGKKVNKVIGPANPTLASRNFIDSQLRQISRFISTTDKSGEYVVPFFDARPVEMSLPNLALTGMGIYHRGAPGFGGFFNFRLFTIDIAEYMMQHNDVETT